MSNSDRDKAERKTSDPAGGSATPGKPKDAGSRQQTHPGESKQPAPKPPGPK